MINTWYESLFRPADEPANSVKWWSSGLLHHVIHSIRTQVSEKYAVTILTVTAFGSRTLHEILYSTQCENPEDHTFGHLTQKP
jgi:hypothetical protein